jgi:hypothetical protein
MHNGENIWKVSKKRSTPSRKVQSGALATTFSIGVVFGAQIST